MVKMEYMPKAPFATVREAWASLEAALVASTGEALDDEERMVMRGYFLAGMQAATELASRAFVGTHRRRLPRLTTSEAQFFAKLKGLVDEVAREIDVQAAWLEADDEGTPQ